MHVVLSPSAIIYTIQTNRNKHFVFFRHDFSLIRSIFTAQRFLFLGMCRNTAENSNPHFIPLCSCCSKNHSTVTVNNTPIATLYMEDPNTTTSECSTSSAFPLHTITSTTPSVDNRRQYDLNHELTKLVSMKGSVTKVKKLLEQRADPNGIKDVFCKGALYHAIERKNPALVRLLLEHKADPDATFTYNIYDTKGTRSMLWLAARSYKTEIVHTLLQYVKKKNPKCDPPYENSIMEAIRKENLALVQLLYEAGVSMPFKKKSLGRTNPLKYLKDSQLRIYLMQNGMYIPRKYLVTICSKRNNPNCYNELRAVCERGADVNPCHKQCESKRPAKCECKCPLAITTCAGQVDLSLLLLNFGADPNGNWKSCNRGYPLIYTRAFDAFRNTPTEHSTKTLGLLRTLLTLGADPTIAVSFDEHNKSKTALDNIIRIDYYKLLVAYGAVLCPRDRIVSNELLQYIATNDLSATRTFICHTNMPWVG